MKKKINYVALLTIPKMPQDRERLVKWLRDSAKQIKKEDIKAFATPCRFRLMK